MSIEKIKQRILMIENNDFTTDGLISEDIKLSGDEIKTFLDPRNKKSIKATSIGFDNTNKVSSAHARVFGGGVGFEPDGKIKNLSQNVANLINQVYKEMEVLGILPDDLTPNTYVPKIGYTISYRGNRLDLENDNEIILQFKNKRLDDLEIMYIVNVGNFNPSDFNTLVSVLNTKKTTYNIRDIKTPKTDTIQLEF